MTTLPRQIRLSLTAAPSGVTDGDLLGRFRADGDQAAFELLVHRHGAMLFGLCRKLLHNTHDAEDAVQATFLTLACRAGSVQKHASLGSWLYKVGYRICLRARQRTYPVPTDCFQVDDCRMEEPRAACERREKTELLADELLRLSERLRLVIVLCYLEGKSSSEAAAELGCPVNTIATRLCRAREELRRGLQRRGIVLSGAIAGSLGVHTASALPLPPLARSLAHQAKAILNGTSPHEVAAPAILRMMKGVQVMSWWKPLLLGAALLLIGAATALPVSPTAEVQPLSKPEIVQLSSSPQTQPAPGEGNVTLPQDVLSRLITPPPADPNIREVKKFDIDDDGLDDLLVYTTTSRGPMSSGFAHYRLKALHGAKLLRGGVPLPDKTPITVADVLHGTTDTLLCHVGGSLMFPEKSYKEFSSGPWWGRTGALGVAKMIDANVQIGYVVLSVSDLGEVTVKDTRLEIVEADPVTVSMEPQDNDVADVKSKEHSAGGDKDKKYFLIEPKASAPADGYGLLIVLPGGDGSANFHSFVKRIYKNGLPARKYIVAQPVAKKWANNQQITWPIDKNGVAGQKFTTEEFIDSIIDEVAAKHKMNRQRVFTLGWSSGGPAVYAASLSSPKVTGSFVAMSVFNPRFLPPLDKAKGHAYFLYHSEEDRTCPFRMAKQAETDLTKEGATVTLKTYAGGHGWRGPLYDDIREGIMWLEQNAKPRDK